MSGTINKMLCSGMQHLGVHEVNTDQKNPVAEMSARPNTNMKNMKNVSLRNASAAAATRMRELLGKAASMTTSINLDMARRIRWPKHRRDHVDHY